MIEAIVKRDGRNAEFSLEKIAQAIYKAANAVGGHEFSVAQSLAEKVADALKEEGISTPTVEEIQDTVERILIQSGHARTAKEFILYRAMRTRRREMKTRLMTTFNDLTFKSAEDNEIKRENANIDGDTAMGTMLKYGSESAKQFYDIFVLNNDHARAHREGDIHIHDLEFLALTTTCCQIDIDKLFTGGFCTGHGFLREPNDIASYSALACIAIQSNQNDQHGGQSIPNFDYAMSKGVRKTYRKLYLKNLAKAFSLLANAKNTEELIKPLHKKLFEEDELCPVLGGCNKFFEAESELLYEALKNVADDIVVKAQEFAFETAETEIERSTYQAMEAFVHNLNTMHSRAGAQIPFSSINYGCDTSLEGRMVIRNILLAAKAGLGGGETLIFPIQIFKVKEGVNYNPGDPNYDLFKLAIEVSAERLFPNFSFLDAPFNAQYYVDGKPETEVAYMGCRTRVVGNNFDKSRETVNGRGNLSFTSINLPRIAIRSHSDIDMFYELLDTKINLVIDQLLERFEIQAAKRVKNFPFLMGQGIWMDSENLSTNDEIREVIKHGTLSLGFIGLAETLRSLIGSHHGQTREAQNLGLEIIGYMRRKMDQASEKHGLNFSLIATPAEGLSGRFVKMDKELYGTIEGVTDREYYTNSFHVPVYHKIQVIEKIGIEAPYHAMTNGGHITYVEMDGNPSENLEAFERVIRTMKDSGIGYGSVNHPVDRDPVCGYTGVIGDKCPKCGRIEDEVKFERIRRITGYLVGTLSNFNNAKRAEEGDRVRHSTDFLAKNIEKTAVQQLDDFSKEVGGE